MNMFEVSIYVKENGKDPQRLIQRFVVSGEDEKDAISKAYDQYSETKLFVPLEKDQLEFIVE